jgi:hypothetical protein
MALWTYVAQANQTSHFTRTRTLCDFPILIGEILRRADLHQNLGCKPGGQQPINFQDGSVYPAGRRLTLNPRTKNDG